MSAQERALWLWLDRYARKYGDTIKALVIREPLPLGKRLEHDLFWSKFGAPMKPT